MSSFLNKGKRNIKIQQRKTHDKVVGEFQKTLLVMNEVFKKLSEDPELDDENFEDKVKEITSFKFTEKQLNMLRRDLIVDLDDLIIDEETQPANETTDQPI